MEAFKYYISNNFDKDILSLLETNSIISITDSLGRIEYVNGNFCSLLECDESVLLGETLKLLKSPLHSDLLYKNLWKTIKLGHKWNGILSAESVKGKQLWLDTSIVPLKKENALRYVIVYKDITTHHTKNINLLFIFTIYIFIFIFTIYIIKGNVEEKIYFQLLSLIHQS